MLTVSRDKQFLLLALKEAKKGYGYVSPNPMVGAVLVKNDEILAKGFHSEFGKAHAEVEVLRKVSEEQAEGATLYVTLEPCVHFGKTDPCVNLIVAKKIARVVYGQKDPNPLVNGKAEAILRAAGIEVELIELPEIAWLNRKFNKWIGTKNPYICLKAGVTLDSKIADKNFTSKWITGSEARKYSHKIRQGYDAILVGASTAKLDDPNLGLHGLKTRRELFRFIMTRDKDFYAKNMNLQIFRDDNWVLFSSIEEMIEECRKRDLASVLVEGGAKIWSEFLRQKMFDEINLFVAPKLLGTSHLELFKDLGISSLGESLNLNFKKVKKIGSDILMVLC